MVAKKYPITPQQRDRICYMVSMVALAAKRGHSDPVLFTALVFAKAWDKPPTWYSHYSRLGPRMPPLA
jgi:hypothetical protein